MNNFQLALNKSWNKYYAFNEFLGSGLLVLLIIVFFFMIQKYIKNKSILALTMGVTFIAVTEITTVVGHFYGGASQALAFLNPISVILNAVMRNHYSGIPYLVGFEFIGSLAGGVIGVGVIKGMGANLKEFAQDIVIEDKKIGQSITREVFLNVILCLVIISVPIYSWINSTSDMTLSYILIGVVVTILLLVSQKNGYFVFMLPLTLIFLLIKVIFDKVNLKQLLNVAVMSTIHIAIAFLIGAIFYKLIHTGKVYYSIV